MHKWITIEICKGTLNNKKGTLGYNSNHTKSIGLFLQIKIIFNRS